MKLTNYEKRVIHDRLKELKNYLLNSLESRDYDDYFNLVNSRELKMLEETLFLYD